MQTPKVDAKKLSEFKCGERGTLLGIDDNYPQKSFLLELGFTDHCLIEVLHKAPFGDPLHVRVRNSEFALRKTDARHLNLIPLAEFDALELTPKITRKALDSCF